MVTNKMILKKGISPLMNRTLFLLPIQYIVSAVAQNSSPGCSEFCTRLILCDLFPVNAIII